MPTIRTYVVRPVLPAPLASLEAIARNLWWSWNPQAIELYRRLDRDLWDEVEHNPLAFLGRVGQDRLDAAAKDDVYLSKLSSVAATMRHDLQPTQSWYGRNAPAKPVDGVSTPASAWPQQRIAYFCAEFGLHESARLYSGGLGILAGDHLKSASDLGLPLVGVGLLYHEAFHQHLNADGWQQETHPLIDLSILPLTLQRSPDGAPLKLKVDFPGRALHAQIWRLEVGRVPLFLLDTNLPENSPEDQHITHRLYGGDLEMRIKQELLLGIGGLRALDLVGMRPAVVHMNEGHAAFCALERMRVLMRERGLTFAEARELAASGNVFTTHTPVPAGNDRFPPEMVDRYLSEWYQGLGIGRDEFLALGREERTDANEHFCMTVLALRTSAKSNGVAQLHGHVSRQMWKRVYGGTPTHEIPIGAVTNGIHHASFLSDEMRRVYERHLGAGWTTEPQDPAKWERVDGIPDHELWAAHEQGRARLVEFARRRVAAQFTRRGLPEREVVEASAALDANVLTIGFARRFATYKRATLILRDPDRLARILNNPERPVQLLFSGKAHQKDEAGKDLIRKVVQLARQPQFRHRILFLEDYDINVARHLVQGVDIWLNTPLRPLEASGTSGMKAVVNGGIHVSILDGWWAEAYDKSVGWAIGEANEYADKEVAEKVEAEMLYAQLEGEIIPRFYARGENGLPTEWIALMKRSIRKLAPFFNTHRMVRDYLASAYDPCASTFGSLSDGREHRARSLAQFKARVRREWDRLAVRTIDVNTSELTVGEPMKVSAKLFLGELSSSDVDVQLFTAPVDPKGQLIDGAPLSMHAKGREGDQWLYEGELPSHRSGRYGFGVRVLPKHDDLSSPFEVVPVKWG